MEGLTDYISVSCCGYGDGEGCGEGDGSCSGACSGDDLEVCYESEKGLCCYSAHDCDLIERGSGHGFEDGTGICLTSDCEGFREDLYGDWEDLV